MATVLVTVASDFAGTYIVEELLEHGYKWVFHRLRPVWVKKSIRHIAPAIESLLLLDIPEQTWIITPEK